MYKRKIYMIEFDCGDMMSVELNHDGGISLGGENGDGHLFVDSQNHMDFTAHDLTELFTVFSAMLRDRKAAR